MSPNETPEGKRERLRQQELKKNATGSLGDGLNRAKTGNVADLAGGMGWKGLGILILVLIVAIMSFNLIFR